MSLEGPGWCEQHLNETYKLMMELGFDVFINIVDLEIEKQKRL